MMEDANAGKTKAMEARPYQLELVDYIMERNGIIYLPTGAGKTFVAILALKRYAHTLREPIKNGGKRAIFMCNTVELARQQAREVKNNNFTVGLYVGDRGVDNWNQIKWETEIVENQVLVGTAQIFVDIIAQNLLKVTDLSVVIIDECHHATGNHPMHTFLSTFTAVDQSKLPRVIGLTGVLIKGNKLGNVVEDLRKLEATMRGNIITVRSMEQMQNVMVYSTKPFEELVSYSSTRHIFQVEEKIVRLIEECKEVIDNTSLGKLPIKLTKNLQQLREPGKKNYAKNLLNDFLYQMTEFGMYAASLAIMSPIIDFEIKKRQSETLALRNLYRVIIQHCERIRHIIVNELKSIIDPVADADGNEGSVEDKDIHSLDVMLNYASPKLKSLLSYITEKFKGKKPEDIACLIFVQRRYTAKCIYHVIMRYAEVCPDLRTILRPQFMVGRQNILGSVESILEAKWNKSAIDQFRANECNIIVCSSVLEEGIDIQACNYVFAFDPLKTFNSYIQTKGRARSQNSYYSIFTPSIEQVKTVEQIKKYRGIHELIKQFLMTRILEQEDPNEEEIAKEFVDLIPPFVIPSGAQLLASSALSTLHRYCQSLPWDSFGACLPWYCKLPPNKHGIAVSIRLPLQSTVKETIIGDYMKSAREAKISAAFKACVKLYENGELNQYLLPVTKLECIAKVAKNLFDHWEKFDDNVSKKTVGKQLRRLYDRKCPEELYNAMPNCGEPSYAYSIEFQTEFEVNSYNEHIVKYLNNTSTYAILLNKKLPKLAEMPLFMSQGKIRVKISENPIKCVVQTKKELLLLQHFHTMIFRDILNLWKDFLVMDHRNMENSYLLVPLNEKRSIDWTIVEKYQRLQPARPPTVAERQNVVSYNPNDYLDKVISKWYIDGDSERFIVTKICDNLTPSSPFGSNSYDTYASFFKSRYNVSTFNKSQFLLEVKALTHRRNFFNNASNKSAEQKKERNKIILIPELCHNYEYPGNLWLKALFLPSILHRVTYMLHAETLRKRINLYLGLDRHFTNYTPKPLIIDCSLKRAMDDDGNLIKAKEYPKKLLSSLPTKEHTDDYHVQSLESDDVAWKLYLEPIDLDRKLDRAYPVEVDYYYKFISAIVTQMDNLKLKQEEEWTQSQFEVRRPKREHGPIVDAVKQLSVKDSSPAEKMHIAILKQNVQPDHKLQSAEQYELLAALTTAGVLDIFDMERFELLGDAFLKFSTSLYLANKYTTWNEGFLTIVKGRMVSNRNLLYCLMGTDICKRICSSPFKPSTGWLPPLCSLPSNLLQVITQKLPNASILEAADFYNLHLTENEIRTGECLPEKLEYIVQACNRNSELVSGNVNMNLENDMNLYLYKDVVRDKVVADALEAILGVCVKNYGIHRSFRMLEFFGICKSDRDNPLTDLLDLKLKSRQLRTNVSRDDVSGFLINAHILETNLGYKFRDRAYLLQALTHPSYPTNRVTGCYQELEFIGDAILDMLVTSYIFERHQNMDPGKMTDLRSALVNNITLGCVCVRQRFHLFLLYENAHLSEAIKTFADFQDTQNHCVTDQVRILMEEDCNEVDPYSCIDQQEEDPDEAAMADDYSSYTPCPRKDNKAYNMAAKVDVPKALGDIVEALIGAVYLDCRDLEKTWHVIYRLLEHELHEFSRNVPIDPVRQLGEIKQANPKYTDPMIDNEVVMVKCIFNCLDKSCTTNGFGSNAILAKKAAAKQALQILTKYSN